MWVPLQAFEEGGQLACAIMMYCAGRDLTQYLRRKSQPICYFQWLVNVIGEMVRKECAYCRRNHMMIYETFCGHFRDIGSWINGRLGEIHWVAIERVRKVLAQ